MTVNKNIRVPLTYTSHIEFAEPLAVMATDKVELDYRTKIAAVVNSAGRIKEKTRFKEIRHGQELAAGD